MPEEPPPESAEPDAGASRMRRRDLLRTTAWAGGIAGTGAIAGYAANRLGNPKPAGTKAPLGEEFTYDVSRFQKTDPALIRGREEGRFATGMKRPRYLAVAPDGTVWVAGEGGLRQFTAAGDPAATISLPGAAWSVLVRADGRILAGEKDRITILDASGAKTGVWTGFSPGFLPTGLAESKDAIYAADAKNRVVLKLDASGKTLAVIGERNAERGVRGFVIPSPYFCVRVAPDGLLRVSNPGTHQIEAYTPDGAFELAWGKPSFSQEGFCGCCNPVSFDVLPDGGFVTCEKGLPRVKLYDAHGDFTGVLAGPESFPKYLESANGGASEAAMAGIYAAAAPGGKILVLDSIAAEVRRFTLQAHA